MQPQSLPPLLPYQQEILRALLDNRFNLNVWGDRGGKALILLHYTAELKRRAAAEEQQQCSTPNP